MDITTLDYHTAGEPLRIVTGGLPPVPGESMAAKRRHFRDQLDAYRQFLMWEPRGHADMYGAVLTDPVTEDGDVGVLFLHNEGYSTMCGHGIIALATAAVEQGAFDIRDPGNIRIDAPAGRIVARVDQRDGRVQGVRFDNVPSLVLADGVRLEWRGKSIHAAVAYGGAWYAYVDAAEAGLQLNPANASKLITAGRELKSLVAQAVEITHPGGGGELDFLYGVIFCGPGSEGADARNVCIFADGELDRSPTGTGVSGWAAIQHHRGHLQTGESRVIASIINSRFTVRLGEPMAMGQAQAVATEVAGSAHLTGEHRFILDPADPLGGGFFLR